MKYDPYYHHRRSIRLKGYDYSSEGYYFVTMCSLNRKNIFSSLPVGAGLAPALHPELPDSSLISNINPSLSSFFLNILKLTRIGEIINRQWKEIPKNYKNVTLDEYVIMPNHFHGILLIGSVEEQQYSEEISTQINMINPSERAPARGAPTRKEKPSGNESITLGSIVGSFKSLCVTENLKYIKDNSLNELGKIWQRDYYDHIIRNNGELERIRKYIQTNPYRWLADKENNKYSGAILLPIVTSTYF